MVNGQCLTTMVTTGRWSSGQDMGFGDLGMVSMPIYREVRQYQHQIPQLVTILDFKIKTVVNIAYRILIYLSTNYVKNNNFYADVTDYDA